MQSFRIAFSIVVDVSLALGHLGPLLCQSIENRLPLTLRRRDSLAISRFRLVPV